MRLVTDAAEFARMRAEWNDLAALARAPGPFLCHEWFDAAWQWRRQSARLYLLCFFVDRRLTAALPLVLEDISWRGLRRRELSFLTVPDTQACDLIVADSDSAAAAKAFADELARRRGEWDVIRLKYLAPGTVTASAFQQALAAVGYATHRQPAPGNPFIPLDSTWVTYYATRSRRLKKANNLATNRLKSSGNIRIERLAPGAAQSSDLDSLVDRAIAVSAKSWKTRTGNSLDNAGPQAFIRRLSRLAHERGWLSIWLLSLNDRPLAMEYQLVANDCVYALRSDFDAEFEEISPGTYLNRHLLEQLFGVGLQRYYMGPGDNAYKHRWTEQVEPMEALTIYGRSLAGRWLAALENTLKPLARNVRDRLRAPASNNGLKESH